MAARLIHICFRVENLESSVQFYSEALGYRETKRLDFPDDAFTLVYLRDPLSQVEIELTYNYGHGPYDRGTGYGHIAVEVEDLMASYEKHEKMGCIADPITSLPGGSTSFYFIQDPDGYQIEVIGPMNRSGRNE